MIPLTDNIKEIYDNVDAIALTVKNLWKEYFLKKKIL